MKDNKATKAQLSGEGRPLSSPISREMAQDPYLEATRFRNFAISRKLICGASATKANEATSNAAE